MDLHEAVSACFHPWRCLVQSQLQYDINVMNFRSIVLTPKNQELIACIVCIQHNYVTV